jgi:hypothetical protein
MDIRYSRVNKSLLICPNYLLIDGHRSSQPTIYIAFRCHVGMLYRLMLNFHAKPNFVLIMEILVQVPAGHVRYI